jgi:hypothetical protein
MAHSRLALAGAEEAVDLPSIDIELHRRYSWLSLGRVETCNFLGCLKLAPGRKAFQGCPNPFIVGSSRDGVVKYHDGIPTGRAADPRAPLSG